MRSMRKTAEGKAIRGVPGISIRSFVVVAVLAVLSCTGNDTAPPDTKTAKQKRSISSKAQWADMLLRPADSVGQDWVSQMADWPDTLRVTVDSTGRAQIVDLTFAFDAWVFKNLDWEDVPERAGLRVSLIVAGTYVPSHLLMKDFTVDSVLFYLPGESEAAGGKEMFAARRKFLDGVWQVEFLPTSEASIKLDFPEGTRLKPRVFVSWRGKKIIFEMPRTVYEHIRSPQPLTDTP